MSEAPAALLRTPLHEVHRELGARLVADGLSQRLGVSVVVENRPGAGATTGSQLVADAAPDGQTLVMSNIASHAISPTLYRNLRYDPVRSFTHIAMVITNPSRTITPIASA